MYELVLDDDLFLVRHLCVHARWLHRCNLALTIVCVSVCEWNVQRVGGCQERIPHSHEGEEIITPGGKITIIVTYAHMYVTGAPADDKSIRHGACVRIGEGN